MKIIIAGGSGFLGRALVEELSVITSNIVVLSRSDKAQPKARTVLWDGVSAGSWVDELEDADAIVNLSGSPILSLWTPANRKRILDSRVMSTRTIGAAIAAAKNPPSVWINGSATGYYGDRGGWELSEREEPGKGFLANVCVAWERAATAFDTPGTRVVLLRTGVVFDRYHPPLSLLVRLSNCFLGGAVGRGRAYIPWIHVGDHARVIRFCIEKNIVGPVNAVAPMPVTNGELMAMLRRMLNRPWSPPMPSLLIKALSVVGFPSEAVLSSTCALPAVLEAAGFRWLCPKPESAIIELP